MNKSICWTILFVALLQSCASKKDILYFQDAANYASVPVIHQDAVIQSNDILSIAVSALVPETALPYNIQILGGAATPNLEILKLQGYLVSTEGTILFPILGKIQVVGKTIPIVAEEIKKILESGGHLVNPKVSIRILNAKVTVLGEVNQPGTFTFPEQYITVPQA